VNEYPKIQSLYKRSLDGKQMLYGEWSLPEFEYLADNLWTFTEKVDGTNVRVLWDGAVVTFGGRSDNAQMPMPLLAALTALFPATKLAEVFPNTPICLYGEGYGAKIQCGGVYRQDQSFVLFDVLIGRLWLQRADVVDVGRKLNIDVVPIIGQGRLIDMEHAVRLGITSRWGNFPAEGIVARPAVELRTRRGARIIVKLKTRDFSLLRYVIAT